MKERVTFIHEFVENGYFLFERPRGYDRETLSKKWNESKLHVFQSLTQFISLQDFEDALVLENSVKNWMVENSYKPGDYLPLLRIALAGTMKGPAVFDMCILLGKIETIARLELAAKQF